MKTKTGRRLTRDEVLEAASPAVRALNRHLFAPTAPHRESERPAPAFTPTTRAPRGPNKTEQRYADDFLQPRMKRGEILAYDYEAVVLYLPGGITYRPDWRVVVRYGEVEFHEVKGGHVWEDARLKWKAAVAVYREDKFVWTQWRGGRWEVKEAGGPR